MKGKDHLYLLWRHVLSTVQMEREHHLYINETVSFPFICIRIIWRNIKLLLISSFSSSSIKRELCLAVLSFELNNFCIIQHHYIINKKHGKIN
jgi:hypothetical protein